LIIRIKQVVWVTVALLGTLSGCKWSDKQEQVIVKYRDAELTLDELRFHIPKDANPTDSARYAKLYIEQWKMEQCLIEAARSRISGLEETVEYQMRDYRRKMMVDALHRYLLENNPAPAVTDQEAERYYKDNIQQFISGGNMYWYAYIKSSNAQIQQLNNQIISPNVNERTALLEWAKKNAEEYKLDDAYTAPQELNRLSEIVKNDLSRINPNTNPSLFLTNEDNTIKYHLFFMRDVVKPGKYIPFASVKDEIKKTITLRKQTLEIERFEANTYEQAQAAREFIEKQPSNP
jgi:hypothetical protein